MDAKLLAWTTDRGVTHLFRDKFPFAPYHPWYAGLRLSLCGAARVRRKNAVEFTGICEGTCRRCARKAPPTITEGDRKP